MKWRDIFIFLCVCAFIPDYRYMSKINKTQFCIKHYVNKKDFYGINVCYKNLEVFLDYAKKNCVYKIQTVSFDSV